MLQQTKYRIKKKKGKSKNWKIPKRWNKYDIPSGFSATKTLIQEIMYTYYPNNILQ
jgi:hypothetical protein